MIAHHHSSRLGAIALVAPMLIFLLLVFAWPLAGMLGLAVRDGDLASVMPRTVEALQDWDGAALPSPATFAAAAADLAEAAEARTVGIAAKRLGYDDPAWRKIVTETARALRQADQASPDWQATLISIDPRWGQPQIWAGLRAASGPLSDTFLLEALDLQRDPAGAIIAMPEANRIYIDVLARTFGIAAAVTALTVLLALPTACLLMSVAPPTSRLLMIAVLLPLWTSVLVRSAAWTILLQDNGLVNATLLKLGVISAPLSLMYNRTGVVIALTHVLLPFAVLPILTAMRNVPKTQTLAASSMGAGPVRTFFEVYLPQILSGISAGGLLVFILTLGYYITPLLLGGPSDQLLPYYIAQHTTQTANWGLAAALGAILLTATVLLYALYVRLVGVSRIGMG